VNTGAVTDCMNDPYGTVSGQQATGGICGENRNGATVTNCTNRAAISGTADVGGIAGNNNGGSITNCSNSFYIFVGGTLGPVNNVSGTGDRVGGIAGGSSGPISKCTNSGPVKGSGNYTGGIVGRNLSGNSNDRISDCTNNGEVSGSEYVGGIVGRQFSTVIACSNTGKVSGSRLVGGICGFSAGGGINASKNTGDVTAARNLSGGITGENNSTITACYNTGAITAEWHAGGIVGYLQEDKGIITACYSTGRVYLSANYIDVGGIVGNSEANATVTACYWLERTNDTASYRAKYGIGYLSTPTIANPGAYIRTNTGAEKFASGMWPAMIDDPEWGIGTGGSGGYWKSLGAWNGGGTPPGMSSDWPKLYWE
jgi:hypothetical protein